MNSPLKVVAPQFDQEMGHRAAHQVHRNEGVKGGILFIGRPHFDFSALTQKLQENFYYSDCTTELEKAKTIFCEERHQAIVLDLHCSGNDQILESILHFDREEGTPVIGLTTTEEAGDFLTEALNGGLQYILKAPLEFEKLSMALNQVWGEPRNLIAIYERFFLLKGLTPREKEIGRLLLKGLTNKEIAQITDTTEKTVKCHLTTVFEKCSVGSRSELFNTILCI